MKIYKITQMKYLLQMPLIAFMCALLFLGCDESSNQLGSNIQPTNQYIGFQMDSLSVKARTVSLDDSIYALSTSALLGEYRDDVFGSIFADYLTEFYFDPNQSFYGEEYGITIDSVGLLLAVSSFIGDKYAPMGISVYGITSPLEDNLYTNIDPDKYCDRSQLLSQSLLNIEDYSSSSIITLLFDKSFGQRFYDLYKSGEFSVDSREEMQQRFRNFLPGFYVTSTLGSAGLMNVSSTVINIKYSYTEPLGNYNNTQDTVKSALYMISGTSEVIQLRRVKNTLPVDSDIFDENSGCGYIKTPAGLTVELELPIVEMAEKMAEKGIDIDATSLFLNYGKLVLTGYTEKEPGGNGEAARFSSLTSSACSFHLLLIDRDSIGNFFSSHNQTDGIYESYSVSSNDATYNTYTFSNLSTLLGYYLRKYKDGEITQNPKFLLMPVLATYSNSSFTGFYNLFYPTTSIIRTDASNLELKYAYSKY
jgi:hypothetical protein